MGMGTRDSGHTLMRHLVVSTQADENMFFWMTTSLESRLRKSDRNNYIFRDVLVGQVQVGSEVPLCFFQVADEEMRDRSL
jgi:hypothetical protein